MEEIIISNLVYNEEYARKVLPYLKDEYFTSISDRTLFHLVRDYLVKYNSPPTKESLYVDLSNGNIISDDLFEEVKLKIRDLESDPSTKIEWLFDNTEKFCQEKALSNALLKAIDIVDEGEKNLTKSAIPQLLQEALQVSFDNSIGHNYLKDVEHRLSLYRENVNRIPTGIDILDMITKGGFMNKALYCFMAPSGVGKSLVMGSLAANILRGQKNVLYISMEMSEDMIGERIDANIMDMSSDDFRSLSDAEFIRRFNIATKNIKGNLVIREYPAVSANASTIKALIQELKLKQNFTPDILFVDYLNICSSSRYRAGSVNSYTMVKAITEEFRALGSEEDIPVVTATQVNRGGTKNMDLDMEDVADSYGLIMTTDLLIGITQDEELDERGLYLFKQVKNRYYPTAKPRRFMVGVDKAKMKIYNAEQDYTLYEGPEDTENGKPKKPVIEGFN